MPMKYYSKKLESAKRMNGKSWMKISDIYHERNESKARILNIYFLF